MKSRVHVDFNNADQDGRLRLNLAGTTASLDAQHFYLQDGVSLVVCDDELECEAVVQFNTEEGIWVGAIDWEKLQERR